MKLKFIKTIVISYLISVASVFILLKILALYMYSTSNSNTNARDISVMSSGIIFAIYLFFIWPIVQSFIFIKVYRFLGYSFFPKIVYYPVSTLGLIASFWVVLFILAVILRIDAISSENLKDVFLHLLLILILYSFLVYPTIKFGTKN